MHPSLQRAFNTSKDVGAVVFGTVLAPVLRFIATRRTFMPRFQRFEDKAGFQLRTSKYYEPTYAESDLPADTTIERSLPGLDLNEAGQLVLLGEMRFGDELLAIPTPKAAPHVFGYDNDMYSFGDAELYYNVIRLKKPRRIIEIGSGNSTLVARLAIDANIREDASYACDLTCIEPYEMPWLEGVGVTVKRQRVEHVALETFDVLEPDDILFIDSSHVLRPFGDVLREFQEIVPRVAAGVLIHIHDIFTPRDYPETWLRIERRLWNEQYLLESFLTYNDRFDIICAANWLKHNHFEALARACPNMGKHPDAEPSAFWIQRKAAIH